MKFIEVMEYFNFKMSNIARALKVDRRTVYNWRDGGKIPYHHQCNLQLMSKGELIATYKDAGIEPPAFNQHGWGYDQNTDARA